VNRPSPNPSSPLGPDIPMVEKLIGDDWGGTLGGNVTWENVMSPANVVAYYWSQSIEPAMNTYGMYMGYQTNGTIYVNYSTRKELGFPVRCVR
jgi:hypothetical protein